MDDNKIRKFAEMQTIKYEELLNNGEDTSKLIGFESDSGQWIINPYLDESMIKEVNPVEYYGEKNFNDYVNQI